MTQIFIQNTQDFRDLCKQTKDVLLPTDCQYIYILHTLHYTKVALNQVTCTLTAMTVPLRECTIRFTVPYAPRPISPSSTKSSAVKSNVYNKELTPSENTTCSQANPQ